MCVSFTCKYQHVVPYGVLLYSLLNSLHVVHVTCGVLLYSVRFFTCVYQHVLTCGVLLYSLHAVAQLVHVERSSRMREIGV